MTKLSDTQKQVERLKELVEKFLACDEDDLLDMYEEYQQFKGLLADLLSTIARYRLQLHSTDETIVFFGPKTRKVVEELVRHYDKVYEIDEHLVARFLEVERVNAILANRAAECANDDESKGISILEETKQDLMRIERAKTMEKNAAQTIRANLSNIQHREIVISDALHSVQQVYRNDPATSLESILVALYQDGEQQFLTVLENVTKLITQISKHPDDVTQRLLRINHEKLFEDFIQYPRAVAMLKYARFKIKHSDDVKEHLKEFNLNEMRDEYFLYLKEPDMFTNYSTWKDWIDFIGVTNRILNEFVVQYKALTRGDVHGSDSLVLQAFASATQCIADAQ